MVVMHLNPWHILVIAMAVVPENIIPAELNTLSGELGGGVRHQQ